MEGRFISPIDLYLVSSLQACNNNNNNGLLLSCCGESLILMKWICIQLLRY